MKQKETVGILQFGCAKNLVDMELMLGFLVKNGYKYSLNPDDKNIKTVIINTCSFIFDAEKECVSSIMDMISKGKKIILTGCLVQKHKEELAKLLPEVKHFIGVCEYDKIVEAIESREFAQISDTPDYCYREDIKREQITVGSSSYIKIAEGCYYNCGYCVIPQLRGSYKSRKIRAGSVISKLNLFKVLTKPSLSILICFKTYPKTIVKKMGSVTFRLKIRFSIKGTPF